ncbi:stilbene synthase [Puniceicoccales bacterium CK1056]|uniref:Stilbene synthase n=1 Tax=Oceanipulchritudo coccoides TaxID=2706888 RepID=A0A6B2M2I5_9BACT|nr:stilbene synthase [Oceanipulchritudo coccoides]
MSLETADPETFFTQQECLEIFLRSKAPKRMRKRSALLMEKVLMRNNGIGKRGFSYPEIDTIFDANPGKLNQVFEQKAPELGTRALEKALEAAGMSPDELDGLIVCTCTGYLCPGLSSFIAQQVGVRDSAELTDLVGMGCGAAIPSLRQASHRIAADPDSRIAVIAVEVCSAAFYLDDDPGVIISACLFGDGAAASIWTGNAKAGAWKASRFDSLHLPDKRQLLRFENANGALRNRLSKDIPDEAAKAVRTLYDASLNRGMNPHGLTLLPHTGGRDVLDSMEEAFPGEKFPLSRNVLKNHGNMSSPSVLYVLKEALNSGADSNQLWLTSFGAGFTAYCCCLGRETY